MNPGVTTRYLMWKLPQIGGGEKWWKSHPMGSKPLNRNINSNQIREGSPKKRGSLKCWNLALLQTEWWFESNSSQTQVTPVRVFQMIRLRSEISVLGWPRKLAYLENIGKYHSCWQLDCWFWGFQVSRFPGKWLWSMCYFHLLMNGLIGVITHWS